MSSLLELLTPAPAEVYLTLFSRFLTSFSFPIFVVYLICANQTRWWKRNTRPIDNSAVKAAIIIYNFVVTLVNVYCTYGFALCLYRTGSLYSREKDPYMQWIFTVYWYTKVRCCCQSTLELGKICTCINCLFWVQLHISCQLAYFAFLAIFLKFYLRTP